MNLTTEQQKLVDGLQASIQKGLTSKVAGEGTKALGNVLGGKK